MQSEKFLFNLYNNNLIIKIKKSKIYKKILSKLHNCLQYFMSQFNLVY